MVFYSARKKIQRRIVEYFNYYKVLFQTAKIQPGTKIVYIDISQLAFNRYLYSFLKFFQINDYTVYLPKTRYIINQLCRDKGELEYTSWLLKENFVKFGEPSNINGILIINKEQLSNDYFSPFLNNNLEKGTFHVPMCQYSRLYYKYDWRIEFPLKTKRKRSVFMIGNINRKYYDNISRNNLFNIISRRAMADFIYKQGYYKKIYSLQDLQYYIESTEDQKVILIDTSISFTIAGDKLKQVLKGFDFYLAMPGVIIPQSHNVIEAMSVGCIPILHQTYAELFRPSLRQNINCLVYETLEEFDQIIKNLFNMPEVSVVELRKNVSKYHLQNLTPEAVVKNIEINNYSKIFLQAEGASLLYLKSKK